MKETNAILSPEVAMSDTDDRFGRINKDLLQRVITCFMANEDYPESLKLEIIHAIDSQ